jgi:hypothetical protein
MKLPAATVIIFLLLSLTATGFDDSQRFVEISGTVVIRDRLNLILNTVRKDGLKTELFFVRLAESQRSANKPSYIKVYYQWKLGDPALPSELFEPRKQWRFALEKVGGCDKSIKETIKTYNEKGEPYPFTEDNLLRIVSPKNEEAPLDEVLPCYLLVPNKVESLKLEN